MPKGAALHQHLDSTGDFEYLVYNLSCILIHEERKGGEREGGVTMRRKKEKRRKGKERKERKVIK